LVLQSLAKKLQSNLRHPDIIARIGGDEFVILLPEIYRKHDLKKVSNGLLKQIQKPIDDLDAHIDIGISIGIAIYPEHGNTIDQLILRADKAMYQVKQNGKNNWQTFNLA